MKNLLLVVFIAAMLVAAGCTGQKPDPGTAPVQNPIPTPSLQTVPVTSTAPVSLTPTILLTTAADPGFSRTYTNPEFGFAIRIPECWTASGEYVTTAGQGKRYKVIFDDPALISMQYITITPDSAGLPLEDWVKVFLTQQKTDPSVGVVGQSEIQVDGIPAKKLVLTTGSGEDAIESTIIMTVKGNNAYFMEFTSRKFDYPVYSKEADTMISTIKFS